MSLRPGTLYLVGAGPGDPGLITVRGQEILRRADAVVYDRLVDPAFLTQARPEAQKIYVGKAPGQHGRTQQEIGAVLVGLARAGNTVCRLKGGDPFVFGRGGEEALAAQAAGIRWEVVPGVTSAFGAPAAAGIPVTHRGMASAVVVVTGHEDPAKAEAAVDWSRLAAVSGTIVVMMGVAKLGEIAASLIEAGRDAAEPAAVIENGAAPGQRSVRASLGSVAEAARAASIANPAVAVIGPVVDLLRQEQE